MLVAQAQQSITYLLKYHNLPQQPGVPWKFDVGHTGIGDYQNKLAQQEKFLKK